MKNAFRLLGFVAVVPLLMLSTGCASYLSAAYSADELATNRIMASGNKDAIRALNTGVAPRSAIKAVALDNGAGIGVDLFSLDTLEIHPWRQLGAALVDAGTLYGSYMGVKSISGNNNKQETTAINGNGNANVNVTSSGSGTTSVTVNTGDQSSSTSP